MYNKQFSTNIKIKNHKIANTFVSPEWPKARTNIFHFNIRKKLPIIIGGKVTQKSSKGRHKNE